MITVTCRKRDPKCQMVPKYSTFGSNNMDCSKMEIIQVGNGIYNRRHLRETNPNLEILSSLAKFLVENLDETYHSSIYGPGLYEKRIEIHNGKTVAQVIREEAAQGKCNHLTTEPMVYAENLIRAYDLETSPAKIENFILPIIEPSETDEEYWNRVADEIKCEYAAVKVIIRQNDFESQQNVSIEWNL